MVTSRIFGWLYRMLLVCFVVIAVTGIYLFFLYRPTVAAAWDDIYVLQTSVVAAQRVQRIHWWASQLFLVLSIATAVAGIATPNPQRWLGPFRRWRLVLIAVPVLAVLGSATGAMLAWDQLALFEVTVGTDMTGFVPLFGDEVRFVLIDGRVVTTNQIIVVLAVHILGVTGLSGAALAIGRPGRRALSPAYENEESTEAA